MQAGLLALENKWLYGCTRYDKLITIRQSKPSQNSPVALATADRIRFGPISGRTESEVEELLFPPGLWSTKLEIAPLSLIPIRLLSEDRRHFYRPIGPGRHSLSQVAHRNLTLSGTSWIKKERKNHPCFKLHLSTPAESLTQQDSENIHWAQRYIFPRPSGLTMETPTLERNTHLPDRSAFC